MKSLSFLFSILSILIISLVNAAENINTYESLGIDALKKQEFIEKVTAESKLPVIIISTKGNSEKINSKQEYTECVVDVFNVDEKLKIKEKSAKVKLRGNSTAYYGIPAWLEGKIVPYKIKFTKKTNMLGLHNGEEFKNWVLLKPADDHFTSNLFNYYPLKIAKTIFGDNYYVSDAQLVNVYVNDELQGVYSLCEQNEINEKKLDISVPQKNYNGTDIGYYFEIDNYYLFEPNYFCLDYEKATVKDIRGVEREFFEACYVPKSDVYNEDQVYFIGNYTKNVFNVLYNAVEKKEYKTLDEDYNVVNSTYTNAQDAISALLDVESVVDMYLLYEIVHDYDVGEGSFFFAIDFSENSKVPKLQMVTPWDFNWTFQDSPERYWAATFNELDFAKEFGERSNPWFILLAKENWFHELVSKKWESLEATIKSQLDETEALLDSCKEDLIKVDINEIINSGMTIYESNDLCIKWLRTRFQWMDKTFVSGENLPITNEDQPTNDVDIDNDGEDEIEFSDVEIIDGIDGIDEEDSYNEEATEAEN